jgi:hypothetical protein
MTRKCQVCATSVLRSDPVRTNKALLIISVDAKFTTLFERLFTKVFDVIGAKSANH